MYNLYLSIRNHKQMVHDVQLEYKALLMLNWVVANVHLYLSIRNHKQMVHDVQLEYKALLMLNWVVANVQLILIY